jgi:hypothetical protein
VRSGATLKAGSKGTCDLVPHSLMPVAPLVLEPDSPHCNDGARVVRGNDCSYGRAVVHGLGLAF